MAVFVALLRAVNVGGAGRLPMKELRAACEAEGLSSVSTYVASGNLVFRSDRPATTTKTLLADLLRSRFGLTKNDVFLLTPNDLARTIAKNPFADAAEARPKFLHVAFLDAVPHAGAAKALAAYEGSERIRLDGDRLYLDFVEGAGRSKLTPAFLDHALRARFTSRNWNTVLKLSEMADALA